MQQKFNKSTPQRPDGTRYIDAPLVKFDLRLHLQQIRKEEAYQTRDRNAITLYKSNHLRYVLISLHKGAEMKTHAPDGMSSLQVIDGEVNFRIGDYDLDILPGEILAIHENIPHSLIAKKESALLLTMTTNDEGEA